VTPSLYLVSVNPFAGKSLAALAIGLHLREAGIRVGYFKPVGTLPHTVRGVTTDEDAFFISERLNPDAPLDALCPVLLTPEFMSRALNGELAELRARIRESYARVAAGRDVVIVGGVGTLSRGSLLGLSAPAIAELLGSKVLVLAKFVSQASAEEVLLARRLLGDQYAGTIFNFVGPSEEETLRGDMERYLEAHGTPVLGVIPRDELLSGITVRELVEHLPAKMLCCDKALDELVLHFVIGAMGVASAARYFRQLGDKAVITGGDRADIQLAALQTPTKAIILTGNIYPSAVITRRAQQLGVALLLAPHDTLTTVERVEQIAGRLRVRGSAKVERGRALFEKHVDLERIRAVIGLDGPPGAPSVTPATERAQTT
jgi:hypothetical protein